MKNMSHLQEVDNFLIRISVVRANVNSTLYVHESICSEKTTLN